MSTFSDSELERSAVSHYMQDPPPPTPDAPLSGTADEATELPRVLDRSDPLACARRFLGDEFRRDEHQILYHHRDQFFTWIRSRWRVVGDAELRARLYGYLEASFVRASVRNGKFENVRFKPSSRRVADVLDALKSAAFLSTEINPPAWLEPVPDLPPDELVPCCNGLLHLTEMQLLGNDPDFFNLSSLSVAYDPHADQPKGWLTFLRSLWGNDSEATETLQEAFGYFLSNDTRQQKIFMLVGPKRSGKGTIARILTALLGKVSVAGPTLGSLATNFGLAPLIDKPLAIISDARLSGRSDQAAIVERLLSISGEDTLTIDRKHREPWTGTLPTRFLLLSNELPRLADASGAMASRFVVLMLRNTVYGREDTELTYKLREELSGILRWSLEGLARLRERGRFIQPASSSEAIRELEDLGSPVGAFIRERCEVEPGLEMTCDHLYDAWKTWCDEQGWKRPSTKQSFGRDLRAAVSGITIARPRRDGGRVRIYEGIGLK